MSVAVAVEKMRRWRADARVFVREVIGATPDDWQDEGLAALSSHNRIATKASKGPGKSTLDAWAAWWMLATRPHPKVVCTSITGDNLRDGLWAELSKWQQHSALLKAKFTWRAERIVCNEYPETWWASARTWSHNADPAQQADTLAGVHADHVMFILDEAGGIPDAVSAAAEAALANADEEAGREAFLLLSGNPTLLSGPLYRACTRERHLWKVITINGDPDNPKRSPRISLKWAREQIEKYGRDSPYVIVNVFGDFPPGQSNSLIGRDLATAATRRVYAERDYRDEVRVLGVDVARFGDDRTVFTPRQGLACFAQRVLRDLDTMQVVGQVTMVIDEWRPDAVFVDATGIGAGVVDRLHQLGYRGFVVGVDSGSRPVGGTSEATRCLNRRAEMWWNTRAWLKAGGRLPADDELVDEIAGPLYWFNAKNLLQLESKDEMKARGLASPDKADSLALTFAAPVAPRALRELQGMTRSRSWDYDPLEQGRA